MGGRRRETYSGKAFAISVGWILLLLACYWLISDWQAVPRLINSALATIR